LESALSSLSQQANSSTAETLFDAFYGELHQLARRELARRDVASSLDATTLLHEAYLDIVSHDGASFPDRARFMGYTARVMRGLIIDHARHRRALKRGGGFEITSLGTEIAEQAVDERRLTEISEALGELAKADAALAEIVKLKFFWGFSFAEIAVMRGTSERTVQRKWEKARIYLQSSLRAAA
jgi:RNA polymerase sigma factor (TIGR02999 family)